MFFNRFHLMEFLISILQKLSSCFLGCFGIKDKQLDQTPHTPLLPSHIVEEEEEDGDWRSNSNLATLFQDKEKECERTEETTAVSLEYYVDQEPEDEVRFLKACGTLMDAPAESSEVFNELEWQEQPDEAPGTAARQYETMEIDAYSPEHISLTYMEKEELADEEGNGSRSPLAATGATHPIDNMYAVTPMLPSTATHKVVRFEGHIDAEPFSLRSFLPQTGDDMLDESDASGCHSALCRSSYPTPLSITDNMETPGTIYLSCENSFTSGKRIRTQYVRSILKPMDNFSQWDMQKKEDANSQQQHLQHGQVIRSVKQQENENPEFYTVSQTLFDGELRSKASDMDRPILGLAPSQWNYDEPFHISDKVMIANGIPNSSRKYKEDQKISWHATPFEERLEKALSWEARISQRKVLSGRPIDFDENEECVSD